MKAAAASEDERLQDSVVALEDRVDEQRAKARPSEDVLDDDGAADEMGDDDAGLRDGGDGSVRELVPDDDLRAQEALPPRRPDERGRADLDERRAQDPHRHGSDADPEGDRG